MVLFAIETDDGTANAGLKTDTNVQTDSGILDDGRRR